MSYCACKHCGEPRDCKMVAGIHVDGPCSAGCDGKPIRPLPEQKELIAASIVQDGMTARVW
jgi:hypothetical protein